jgi:branched-chain amino acid transport system permease protein
MGTIIWSGLVLGAVYALVATGFTLIQLPTGVFNFAHGAIVVLGSFLAFQWLAAAGLASGWAVLLDCVIGAAAGLLCELLAVRPLRWGSASVGANVIVTTVGAATALIGLLGVAFGYQPLRVPFAGPDGNLGFLGIVAAPVEIAVLASAVVTAVVAHFWFRLARRGQAYLAVAEDRTAASLRGVNVNTLSLSAFAVAGAFGAACGLITGPITYAIPDLGASLALSGFVALALGGEGSFLGGLVGGLLVGLVATFATRYLGANFSDVAVLVLLLVTLTLRPKGLGGSAEARSV